MISTFASIAAYEIALPCILHPVPPLQVVHVEEDAKPSSETGTIFLTPGPGFGSGRHPTTRMCLDLLENCFERFSYPRILDAGTGNGILAIAAVRLGARNVIGLDIHFEAIETARRNFLVNRVEDRASVMHGDVSRINLRFDLIIANLCPEGLLDLATVLAKCLDHGGHMILSGLRGFDKARALRRLTVEQNLRMIDDRWEDGWSTLLVEKAL
jgi:ribosomal protein L11 methyltransferase